MKKIVILDAATIGDDTHIWKPLEKFGQVVIYRNTMPEQVAQRCSDAFAVLTNKVPVSAEIFEECPELKYIGVLATGYNIIDIESARLKGVTVCNVPGYSTHSVAQLVFALLLELTNRVGAYTAAVNSGKWQSSELFSFRLGTITELSGLVMGIYGFGTIGKKVAEIAHAFGMKIITPSNKILPEWVSHVDMDVFWEQADVISINAAFTPSQKNIINARVLNKMKSSAFLINTARGGFVDEQALAIALNSGEIAGAGVDVLNREPPKEGSPLIGAKNCVITPHVAWQSSEALRRLIEITLGNFVAFMNGKPQNCVV